MIAAGLDLGGTKIEAQLFDAGWTCVERRRIDTPKTYDALVDAIAAQIGWLDDKAGRVLPTGISSAGLVDPKTGLALTANLPAWGRPLPADINARAGRKIAYVNDCSAFTLSEAMFGAARGMNPVVGLIIGTGVGGGFVLDGRLIEGPAGIGGEFGHFAAAAEPVLTHGLPLVRCGCGRVGCTETFISGKGLARIAQHLTGRAWTAQQLAAERGRDAAAKQVWNVWREVTAEVLLTLTLTLDPECIVIGGGLSKADGLVDDLTESLRARQIAGLAIPKLLVAAGGDASGARGAAYSAWQEGRKDG